MSGKKKRRIAPSATPWDRLDKSALTPTQSLIVSSHRSMYEFKHEMFAGDISFFNEFTPKACPRCGDTHIAKRGHDLKGIQRYYCNGCKRSFSPVTLTIFEDRKLPLAAWVDFLLQVFSFDSINQMTRENRRSTTTTPYWMGKLFAVLEGVQEECMLSRKVQIDETYYPIPHADAIMVDGKLLRGLSRNKICIGVGCDDKGHSYFVREGVGKTSAAKTIQAFGTHIKPGSLLVHDMEKGHRELVSRLDLKDERHNAKLISKLADADNPLGKVNQLCFLLKTFLNAHSGFDRADLDGYLNLFSVMMNPPENKMEKVELMLNRAMGNPKTLRFRDFYETKTS